ncbi:MAG: hypothetical protein ACI4QE_02360, partial [Acutalibacteraceae bacterium]
GADIVIQSLHKTLPALTSCALLHICSDRVDRDKVKKYYGIFQTSSPSYVLISSIDEVLTNLILEKYDTENYIKNLSDFRDKCKDLKNITLIGDDFKFYDKGKIVFSLKNADKDGIFLQKILREEYNIETEMACSNHVIAMTSLMDEEKDFNKLFQGIFEIDSKMQKSREEKNTEKLILPKQNISPYKAFEREKSLIYIKNAEGKTSLEYIYAYPPGIPIIVPGEVFTEEIVSYIEGLSKIGVNLKTDSNKYPLIECVGY